MGITLRLRGWRKNAVEQALYLKLNTHTFRLPGKLLPVFPLSRVSPGEVVADAAKDQKRQKYSAY
jgi:hypothetical protein